MQHPPSASAAGRDDPARRAPRRRRGARDRHHQHSITAAINVLDMNAVQAKQHIAPGTRVSGRACGSTPRSRVKHVEVLVVDQRVSASDPRGPRPLPAHHHPASLIPTGCPKSQYAEQLGSMATVHPSDVHLVTSWAAQLDGPLLDAGCGPGHWATYLAEHGSDVHGVDQVPEFIGHARSLHPDVPFVVGSIDALPDAAETYGGVLAWYSLIHHQPSTMRRALDEFARVLRPGGGLLVGFFVGPAVEAFDHATVTAYRWSPDALSNELRAAGFDVIETHTRTASQARQRPHGAIVARLTGRGGRSRSA